MFKKSILLSILLSANFLFGQIDSTWNFKKDKICIPFEFSNNLILVDVFVNNVSLKVILDTGSENNIFFSFKDVNEISFSNPKKTKILGVGNNIPIDALISSNNYLKIKEYETNDFKVLILNENEIDFISKIGKEINGIIGYSFFKNRIIEIDYDKKKIFIHKNRSILEKKKLKKYTKNKIDIIDNKPYIKINSTIKNLQTELNLLVDTGLTDGLWLFKNEKLKESNLFIEDYLGYGLAGEIFGKRARIENIDLADFSFNDILVAYPDSTSFKYINVAENRNGSLGGELLKRFHVFFDYEGKNIYLKKSNLFNEPFNFNMSGIVVQHSGIELVKEEIRLNESSSAINLNNIVFNDANKFNFKYIFKPTYIITQIRKDSPTYNVGLKVEDKIISINNQKAYNLTLQKITDLFQSEDGKKIKIEVEREDKIIEVVFYLKKII